MFHYSNSPYWRAYNNRNITKAAVYEDNFYSLENNWEKWNPTMAYHAGSKVTYKGKVYEAKWWTKGDMPDKKVVNPWETPWQLVSEDSITPGEDKGSTGTAQWNISQIYVAGDRATYNGKVYEAKWWTQGDVPDKKVANPWETPWKLVNGDSIAPDEKVGPGPAKWDSSQIYVGGDKVAYNGKVYEAKWWTQGDVPDKKVANPWETPWKLVK
ncbi:carbohydrate-binding protein [Anaeromicrobium sediminis]|uniref:Chitin-binding type-3 domain-containing protein n=1 Tax=Anaeromicrobium sediminis TaxID=1478221 RepID=A0A267MJA7_9FIRM|nr:carbohydrate-binding protein [Anaeromicrobium sediminis]PAB58998.1 hypothetical protein CCE28_12505 [Anaeromicrobium sediminis]